MSEQVAAQTQTPQTVQYIVYDPARRKRVRRIKYDPARRRRRVRSYDPVKVGGKGIIDSMVDGLGFGLITHAVPIPSGIIGGFSYADVSAGVLTALYEKFYMRRGWTAAIVGAIVGLATGKLVNTLGGGRHESIHSSSTARYTGLACQV